MKKRIALLLIFVITLLLVACGEDKPAQTEPVATAKTETETQFASVVEAETAEEPAESEVKPKEQLTRQEEIEKIIRDRAAEKYRNLEIESVTVNDNLGDPGSNTFIVLVRAEFTISNKKETANKVLEMYMNDVAAWMHQQGAEDIAEIAVFVKDEYNDRTLKLSFEYTGSGFSITDKMGF